MTDPAEEIRQVLDSMKYHANRLQALTADLRRLQALQDSDIRQVVQEAADGHVQAELERNTTHVMQAAERITRSGRTSGARDVWSVPCPVCGAEEGTSCFPTTGYAGVHPERRTAAVLKYEDEIPEATPPVRQPFAQEAVDTVPCGLCGAPVGSPCTNSDGLEIPGVHVRRIIALNNLRQRELSLSWPEQRCLRADPHGKHAWRRPGYPNPGAWAVCLGFETPEED